MKQKMNTKMPTNGDGCHRLCDVEISGRHSKECAYVPRYRNTVQDLNLKIIDLEERHRQELIKLTSERNHARSLAVALLDMLDLTRERANIDRFDSDILPEWIKERRGEFRV